jgi:hypothetical protein
MVTIEKLNQVMVVAHATTITAVSDLQRGLWAGLQTRMKDDDGDVEARTITIAVMAALALAIGAIITKKVTDKANTISLDGP